MSSESSQLDLTAAPSGAAPGTLSFKTQLDAVAYLNDSGYKVSKSQFSRDVKAKKMPTNAEGHFEATALLGYAAAHLVPTGQQVNSAVAKAQEQELSASTQLKSYKAKREKLRYEKEQGLLMLRTEHERELGKRALFFKSEVENFIDLHAAAIIHLVGGDDARLPDLEAFLEEKTAIWMDAWSQERVFMDEGEDEALPSLTGADDEADEEDA